MQSTCLGDGAPVFAEGAGGDSRRLLGRAHLSVQRCFRRSPECRRLRCRPTPARPVWPGVVIELTDHRVVGPTPRWSSGRRPPRPAGDHAFGLVTELRLRRERLVRGALSTRCHQNC
jgi:hypothetical protein